MTDDLEAFLVWTKHRATPFEDFADAGVGGRSWRTGTAWQPGVAEDDAIEQRWEKRVPAPYRTCVSILNAPDRGILEDDVKAIPLWGELMRLN